MQQPRYLFLRRQHGFVLVSSLLLLLVVTIMALSIFRSFGVQERIAGNIREKNRAVQAAISTQEYAEWWLANQSSAPYAVASGIASSADVTCGTTLMDANLGTTQICLNTLPSISGAAVTAWPGAGTNIGVAYTPPEMNIAGLAVSDPSVLDSYYARPRFYITDLGSVATGRGEVYQVDAYSFGLNSTTVALVESTVSISCTVCNVGGL
jgi:type IV pilus assembly protein PilX